MCARPYGRERYPIEGVQRCSDGPPCGPTESVGLMELGEDGVMADRIVKERAATPCGVLT